ncbi:MAG: shikimate dehydrogenase [candidate division Zixibacteria bacterium]|nr:shikimate dehydrogenase [candidate division Zixibacteria bacterium]
MQDKKSDLPTPLAISGTTRVVGVCGHGIRYTLSPAMHNAAFRALGLDYVYVMFDVAPGRAREAAAGIRGLGLAGVNVTKPLKTEMIPFLDELTDEARRIGSVNTISHRDGQLFGATTDGAGLLRALETMEVSVTGRSVLILGSGGAARAACAACVRAGAGRTVVAARNRQRGEETALVGPAETTSHEPASLRKALHEADLVINAVPVDLELEPEWFRTVQTVYDTRYDVADTLLMQTARAGGATTSNGIDMLLYQGTAAFEIWTGCDAPVEVMRAALINGLSRRG